MTNEGHNQHNKSSVLIINDIEIDSTELDEKLKLSDYNPIFVSQPGKGLTLLQHARGLSNPIKAIICNAGMSGMNVFQFVRMVKEDVGLNQLPIIILSSENISIMGNNYRDEPTVTILKRPYSREQLNQAIEFQNPDQKPIEEPRQQRPNAIRILAADDDPINLVVIKSLLNMAGYKVDTVKDGVEAVKAVMNAPYDLILMDICMPIMDGVFATIQIREIEKKNEKPPVPIVAVTAHFTPSQRQRYLEAGMNDVIAKPISKIAIDDCLQNWCSRYSELDQDPVEIRHTLTG
ncbi:MAG: response regulator [Hellea sp.]|nr:response regulator [Hellea sp.]